MINMAEPWDVCTKTAGDIRIIPREEFAIDSEAETKQLKPSDSTLGVRGLYVAPDEVHTGFGLVFPHDIFILPFRMVVYIVYPTVLYPKWNKN